MTPAQMETFRATEHAPRPRMGQVGGRGLPPTNLQRFIDETPFFAAGPPPPHAPRRGRAGALAYPRARRQADLDADGVRPDPQRDRPRDSAIWPSRIVTTSPDVTVSTNLGAWVNRRGLFARESMADTFKAERIPSTYTWEFSPKGQHLELGIAEMNLFIRCRRFGLSPFHQRRAAAAHRHGLRSVHPARGLDAAQLCLLSGCALHAGRHALGRDAGAGGRRAPVDRHAAGRHGAGRALRLRAGLRRRTRRDHALRLRLHAARRRGRPDERTWLRDATGGSVYLRLSTRPLEQPLRR
jgi:pyruvate dehydrogenase E1 component